MRTMLLIAALLLAGCQDFLAQRMVAAPNGLRLHHPPAPGMTPIGREYRVAVGKPEATLAVWVMEPEKKDGVAQPVRGTVICLHGFVNDHGQQIGAAKALRDEGYRAVLVDLRGHGESTGTYLTFGVEDAQDLVQLTDWLQKNNMCGKTLGVFGVSYGAATAIQYAAADPRVTAIVAVAPFLDLRNEAPYFARHLIPIPGWFYSAADFTTVINRMGQLAGFDPDQCSPLLAIARTHAYIRLFHGENDMIIPVSASRTLAAADPERTLLTTFPHKGHLELCFDLFGILRHDTRDWFDAHLAGPDTVGDPVALRGK